MTESRLPEEPASGSRSQTLAFPADQIGIWTSTLCVIHCGGIAGAGDHAYAFESRVGGGIDIPLSPHFVLRMVQADYEATTFANSVNNHQNNLLLGAGVVFRLFHD